MKKLYQDRDWLYRKYIVEELSTPQMGKLCNCSAAAIWHWLHKFNIRIRSCSKARLLIYKNKLYQNKEWLYQKHWIEGLNSREIALLCNCGRRTIGEWLHKFNIRIRFKSEPNHCNLSQKAIEWINGELLGDGCLWSRSPHSAKFKYSSKYPEYAQYVSNTLESFGIKGGKIYTHYYKDLSCHAYFYCSLSYVELLPIRKRWYPNNKKIVPKNIELTPLTCRQWYIGDGSLSLRKRQSSRIKLCTCGFTIKDVEWLVKKLIELEFKATRRPNNNTIGISAYSTKAFLDYIGSCPVKCYQYKFDYEGCKLGLTKSFQPVLQF